MLKEDMERARKVVEDHADLVHLHTRIIPRFASLEFNLSGLCNRRCSFCPRVDPVAFPNVQEYLSLELYAKIMEDLRAIEASPQIVFSAFSEPLLHRQIMELVSLTKEIRPDATLEIKTNGDLLTPAKLTELFRRGLDYLLISLYDGPGSEKKFDIMREEAGLTPEQVMLRVRYWTGEHGWNLNLSNRAGTVGAEFKETLTISEPVKRRCHYPFMSMTIDYNGDVLLCPHDWGKKLINGNLKQMSVLEAWTSIRLHAVRARLRQADRDFAPCNVCNVDGTLTGQKSFDQWATYYDATPIPS